MCINRIVNTHDIHDRWRTAMDDQETKAIVSRSWEASPTPAYFRRLTRCGKLKVRASSALCKSLPCRQLTCACQCRLSTPVKQSHNYEWDAAQFCAPCIALPPSLYLLWLSYHWPYSFCQRLSSLSDYSILFIAVQTQLYHVYREVIRTGSMHRWIRCN